MAGSKSVGKGGVREDTCLEGKASSQTFKNNRLDSKCSCNVTGHRTGTWGMKAGGRTDERADLGL